MRHAAHRRLRVLSIDVQRRGPARVPAGPRRFAGTSRLRAGIGCHRSGPWFPERYVGRHTSLHPVPWDVPGPSCTPANSRTSRPRRFVVAAVHWPSKPFRESFGAPSDGTRGLGGDGQAMAAAKRQLEDLKADASPSERKKLDKAMALLPSLEGDPAKQDEFVKLVLSVVDDADGDETEGLSQSPRAPWFGRAGAAQHADGRRHARHWRRARCDRRRCRPVSEPDALVSS